jgi:crossover junction endodeoxyribonuclease RusA
MHCRGIRAGQVSPGIARDHRVDRWVIILARAYGIPAPQGSKRHVGRGVMVESSKKVKPWRQAVVAAILEQRDPFIYFAGATRVSIEFIMPRPKALARKKLTPHHVKAPDIDKLLRATFDGITDSGVWIDDSIVCRVDSLTKRYAEPEEAAGAVILIEELPTAPRIV